MDVAWVLCVYLCIFDDHRTQRRIKGRCQYFFPIYKRPHRILFPPGVLPARKSVQVVPLGVDDWWTFPNGSRRLPGGDRCSLERGTGRRTGEEYRYLARRREHANLRSANNLWTTPLLIPIRE